MLDESKHRPNEIWADKRIEFYNRSMKSWLQDNNIEMYSIHDEGKSVVAERFIRTKMYKYMNSISNVYTDKLDDTVNKYNTYSTIKMKPIDIKDNTYTDFSKKCNDKDPKFQVCHHVRISKYNKIFAKGYTPNWSEEVFITKKVKNTVPWPYVINNFSGEKFFGTFYEREFQKTNQEELRIETAIKKK